jgi:protein gp37
MAQSSLIEWTDATWNPITGCSPASPGCKYCYAMRLAGGRLRHHPSRRGLTKTTNAGPVWTGELRFNAQWLNQPPEWKRPRKVFVVAHGDLFHENADPAWLSRIFNVMDRAPWHLYQVLTKRPHRARAVLASTAPRRNWLIGVSIEDQRRANERVSPMWHLADRDWNTFVSYEPAIGPVDWTGWEFVRWMISGGENGPRPTYPDWHRVTRDFCARNGIPYLFKQWGSWHPANEHDPATQNCRRDPTALHVSGRIERRPTEAFGLLRTPGWVGMCRIGKKTAGRLLDGRTHDAYPEIAA